MFKRIFIIINPSSGREEPILSYLNKVLQKQSGYWEVAITKKGHDAYNFAKDAIKRNFDVIAVYGGDGTVMEVSQALFRRKTPLLIIPGGTANVLAKEIGINMESKRAVNLLKRKKNKLKLIDMGIFNERPFVVRLNIGILADVVKRTGKEAKERFGRLAYSVTALKHMVKHDDYNFEIDIDGKKISETGVALMIANAGNMGLTGFSVLPQVSITDGFLDLVLIKSAKPSSFWSWVKATLTQKKPRGSIRHWKGKTINVNFEPKSSIVCDDITVKAETIKAKIAPKSLTVVVP